MVDKDEKRFLRFIAAQVALQSRVLYPQLFIIHRYDLRLWPEYYLCLLIWRGLFVLLVGRTSWIITRAHSFFDKFRKPLSKYRLSI